MPWSKPEVDRYISSVQSSSPSLKDRNIKGFLFAKLYAEANEYDLAKRHVSEYLEIQAWDPKAHRFLGQLFEKERRLGEALGCYARSVDLNPAQKDLVLKVAEMLEEHGDGRAERWAERAAKLLPGHPSVFALKEKLLSRQGQQGWNHLLDLLQAELAARPSDPHVNAKLVELYRQDARLDEAVKHCLAVERRGLLRHSLDWSHVLLETLREHLGRPSGSCDAKLSRRLQRELLLAHCNRLRLMLSGRGLEESLDALTEFDQAMQALSGTAASQQDELTDAFVEMRGHLYLHSATLLLQMAQEKEQQWRAVVDLAALCYLLAYQAPRPRPKVSRGDPTSSQLLELLANDRQSQAGHMLFNLTTDVHTMVKLVVERFGNNQSQLTLSELLFGRHVPTGTSFIANDDIFCSLKSLSPTLPHLAKMDNGSIALHGGDLQHLSWLALQWVLQGQRACLRDWLKQLFPRLGLETSKMDTDAPESICLLDLEVFVCGVAFCSQSALQEKARLTGGGHRQLHEPRCMPLPLLRLPSSAIHPSVRWGEWWDAAYSLAHKRAPPGMSAKLRTIVQRGLSTLRAGENHGLQPALLIHWARHLGHAATAVNSGREQKEYVSRSDRYWRAVLPLLRKIKHGRSIPKPLHPLFQHFPSRDIQISALKDVEDLETVVDLLDKVKQQLGDEEEEVVTGRPAQSSPAEKPGIYPPRDQVSGGPLRHSPATPPAAFFTFNSNFKYSDGDLNFTAPQGRHSGSFTAPQDRHSGGLLKSHFPKDSAERKPLTPEQTSGQPGIFGTKTPSGFSSFADAAESSGNEGLLSKVEQPFTFNACQSDNPNSSLKSGDNETEQLAVHDEAALLKTKFAEAQKIAPKLPEKNEEHQKKEPEPTKSLLTTRGDVGRTALAAENPAAASATAQPPAASGFIISTPSSSGGFKVGTQDAEKDTSATEDSTRASGSASVRLKNISDQCREKERETVISISTTSVEETDLDQIPPSTVHLNTSSLADGHSKLELRAATFKSPELATEFKQNCECQRLLDVPLGVTPVSSSPENSGSSRSPSPSSDSPSNYSYKVILSPPKFVFGTDTPQKNIGSPPETLVSLSCSKANVSGAPVSEEVLPQADGGNESDRDGDMVDEPGYTSDSDTDDDESYESAVETLDGELSPDLTEEQDPAQETPEPHDLSQETSPEPPRTLSEEAPAPRAVMAQETPEPRGLAQEAPAPQAADQENREPQDLETPAPQTLLQEGPEPLVRELQPQTLGHETPEPQTPEPQTLGHETPERQTLGEQVLQPQDLFQEPTALQDLGQEAPEEQSSRQPQDLEQETGSEQSEEAQSVSPISIPSIAFGKPDSSNSWTNALNMDPEPEPLGQEAPQSLGQEIPGQETPEPQFMGEEVAEPQDLGQDVLEPHTQGSTEPWSVGKVPPEPQTLGRETPEPQTLGQETLEPHTPEPQTMGQETPEQQAVCQETQEPGLLGEEDFGQDVIESQTLGQETLEPQTPEPQTLGQETLEPQTPEPQTLGQETPEPQTLGQETPEPQTLGQETPEPQTLGQETPEPQTLGQETPEPQTLEVPQQQDLVQEASAPQALVKDVTERPAPEEKTSDIVETQDLEQETESESSTPQEQSEEAWTNAPDMVFGVSPPPAPQNAAEEEGSDMSHEQVLRVCANLTISHAMELKPMNSSANALVCTDTDHTEGEGRVEQLAAKFKTPELTETFRKTCECQKSMIQEDPEPETLGQEAPQTLGQEAPQTLGQETPEPQTLGQETPEPETTGLEAPVQETPEPQSLHQGTPEPQTMGQETPEPQSLHQRTPEPQSLHQETPEPQTMSQEAPEPQTLDQETPEPQTMGHEAPEPQSLSQETPEPQTMVHETPEPLTLDQETPEQQSLDQETPESLDLGQDVIEPQTLLQDGIEPLAVGKEAPEPWTLGQETAEQLNLGEDVAETQDPGQETPTQQALVQDVPERQALLGQEVTQPETLGQEAPEPETLGQEAPEDQVPSQETMSPQALEQETCTLRGKFTDALSVAPPPISSTAIDLNCEPDSTNYLSAPLKNGREGEEAPDNVDVHFEPNLATQTKPSAVGLLPLGAAPNNMRLAGYWPVWSGQTVLFRWPVPVRRRPFQPTDPSQRRTHVTNAPADPGRCEDPSYTATHMSRASQHSRPTNPLVFLSVQADGEPLGTVTLELFAHVVPKTAENFRALCTGERGFGFEGSAFHRVVPDFMCQGGDVTARDGTGGKSIYGGAFEDENFDVGHTSCGLLSMANRGRNTNTSQFYITLTKAEHLDFKHVVFGWVREGMQVVRRMGALGTKSGKPSKTILITQCGAVVRQS